MILLDGTIVNIAIPHIQGYFDTSFGNIEWVMNAYILAFAVLLVTLGRFCDLWGRRKLFVAGIGAVHARLGGLRPGPEHLPADRLPRAAGHRRSGDDAVDFEHHRGGRCASLLRRNAQEARVATEAEAPAGPAGDVAVAQAGDA